MNELYCSKIKCNIATLFFCGRRWIYPHSFVSRYPLESASSPSSCASTPNGNVGYETLGTSRYFYSGTSYTSASDLEFYRNFKRLPPEMREKCLSYCDYLFLLTRPDLWPDLYNMYDDRHFTEDHYYRCRLMNMFFFTPTTARMTLNVSAEQHLQTDEGDKYRFGMFDETPPACYHGEYKRPVELSFEEMLTRCKKFLKYTKSPHDLDEHSVNLLKQLRREYDSVEYKKPYNQNWYTRDERIPTKYSNATSISIDTTPGVYYWELVNHTFERDLAAINSNNDGGLWRRGSECDVAVSLAFRRVCRPTKENRSRNDYTTLATFRRKKTGQGCMLRLVLDGTGVDVASMNQCDCRYESDNGMWKDDEPGNEYSSQEYDFYHKGVKRTHYGHVEMVPIFSHVFAPDTWLCVFREPKAKGSRSVGYFDIRVPSNVELNSVQRNMESVRLNFTVKMKMDLKDMYSGPHSHIESYGKNIFNAISLTDPGYAFCSARPRSYFETSKVSLRLYEFFFHDHDEDDCLHCMKLKSDYVYL